MKLIIIVPQTLFQLFMLFLLSAVTYGQEMEINIIYTGGMDGELEPCGCSPKTDFGGVARISGYLEEHKKELAPYILLDSGNFSDKNTPQGRLKAEAMLKSFSIMEYDAVAFSGMEKTFSGDFFRSFLKEYNVPVVSDLPTYNQSLVIDRGVFKLNLSSVPSGYKKGMLNIFLTGLSIAEAKQINGWDVIISSSGGILDVPIRINSTIIVSGYPKGKKLGVLTVQTDSAGKVSDFKHRWQALGNDIIEDKKVRNVLNDYDIKVAGLLKKAERTLTETTYLGVAKCAECHQPFAESWEKTRHARAFSSLEQAGKSANPECLKCHTVGFGEEGGFLSIETTPGLSNVQCEVCHGFNKEHLSDYSRPMKPVTESVCLNCHTASSNPDFNYPTYLEKIKH